MINANPIQERKGSMKELKTTFCLHLTVGY